MIRRAERAGALLALLAVTLLAGLFTLHRFDDLDVCWHLRTGQWILDNRQIPRVDPFWSGAVSQPQWIDVEWGAQMMAAALARGTGVVGLHLAVAVLVVAVLLFFSSTAFPSPTILVATLLFTLTAWQRFLVRPEILAFPLLLIAMALLDRLPRAPGATPILFGLLTAAWANLHGSFILVPVLLAAGTLGASVGERGGARLRPYAHALVLSLAGALVNPYGFRIYGLFAPYLRSLFATVGLFPPDQGFNLSEWNPTWRLFGSDPLFPTNPCLFLILALGISFLRLGRRASPERMSCVVVSGILALTAVRHLLPFGAVALAIIAENERDRTARQAEVGTACPPQADRASYRLAWTAVVILVATWNLYAVLTDRYYVRRDVPNVTGVGFYPDTTPEGAVQWLAQHEPTGEIFNNYNSGAYLLYRLYPLIRPYLDSRLIAITRYREVQRAISDPAAFDDLVRRDRIGTVVLLHPSPESLALLPRLAQDPRWRMVFRDANTTIHVRYDLPPPSPRSPPLLLPPAVEPAAARINRHLARFKRYTLPAAELTDAFVSALLGDRDRQVEAYRRALVRAPGNPSATLALRRLGAGPS